MRVDPVARLHRDAPTRSTPPPELALPPAVRTRLADAQITGEHLAGLFVWCVGGAVVVALAAALLGSAYAIGLSICIIATPVIFVVARRGRRRRQIVDLLPTMIDRLSRSLRSGASLRGALGEAVADLAPVLVDELQPVLRSLDYGRSPSTALREWANRSQLSEVRLVAAAVALAIEHEAGTTQALDGVSQSLRDRRLLAQEITALTAQASVSMQALVLLPLGFLLIDAAGSQHAVGYLIDEPIGRLCFVAGIVLNLAGWMWMRILTRRHMPT